MPTIPTALPVRPVLRAIFHAILLPLVTLARSRDLLDYQRKDPSIGLSPENTISVFLYLIITGDLRIPPGWEAILQMDVLPPGVTAYRAGWFTQMRERPHLWWQAIWWHYAVPLQILFDETAPPSVKETNFQMLLTIPTVVYDFLSVIEGGDEAATMARRREYDIEFRRALGALAPPDPSAVPSVHEEGS